MPCEEKSLLEYLAADASVQTMKSMNSAKSLYFQHKWKGGLPVIRLHDLRHSAVYALRKGECDERTFRSGRAIATFPQLHVYDPVLGGDMDRLGTVMDKVLFDAVRAS